MFRTFAALLLPALFLLPGHADAQWARPYPAPIVRDALPGVYTNTANGGTCEVQGRRRGYEFVNEKGDRALFGYSAPGQLRMIAGSWGPNIVVTVNQDRRGRTILRFDEPNAAVVYWVSE